MNKYVAYLPTYLKFELGIRELDSTEEVELPKEFEITLSDIKNNIIVPSDYFEQRIEPELKKVFAFIDQYKLKCIGYGLYNSKSYQPVDPNIYSHRKYKTHDFKVSILYNLLEDNTNVFSVNVLIRDKKDVNTLKKELNEWIAKDYEHFENNFVFDFFKHRLFRQLEILKLPN